MAGCLENTRLFLAKHQHTFMFTLRPGFSTWVLSHASRLRLQLRGGEGDGGVLNHPRGEVWPPGAPQGCVRDSPLPNPSLLRQRKEGVEPWA